MRGQIPKRVNIHIVRHPLPQVLSLNKNQATRLAVTMEVLGFKSLSKHSLVLDKKLNYAENLRLTLKYALLNHKDNQQ